MSITPIKQNDDIACGPTSIKMVVDYLKLPYSLEEIEKLSQYKKKDGLSNIDLVKTLEKLNVQVVYKANAKWGDLLRASRAGKAIIVSWMMSGYIGHFSVVDRVEKDFIYLADPHEGAIVKMDKIIFMRLWMDYDDMWYPMKNTDIQLRWMAVVSSKGNRKTRNGR